MIIYGLDGSALLATNPTGVERYASNLIRAMMQLPLKVEEEQVIIYSHLEKPAEFLLPAGWSWKKLGFWLPKGWTHVRLSCELMLHPPTVFFNPAHEIPLLHRRSQIATTVHDLAFRHVPAAYSATNLKRQEWAIKRAVKQAQIIFAVSGATKQDLLDFYKVDKDKVVVTPNAPADRPGPQTEAREVMVKYGLTPGMYILFVGRLENKKNLVTLIRAFNELRRRYGTGHPIKLVLAGGNGHGSQEVIDTARAVESSQDIVLPGYIPDADFSALMSNALCFAFPSWSEGFGMPVIEAMSLGTPVIASDTSALKEVCGGAALLVPPEDVGKWGIALDTLLTNQTLRQELNAKGHDRAKAFSWTATAQATWEGLRAAARE